MPTEADARILIDPLLRDAGWDITDKVQVKCQHYRDEELFDRAYRYIRQSY